MPVSAPIDNAHQSAPAYQVATAQAMAAAAVFLSPAVDCQGWELATVMVSIDTAHAVLVQASLDEVTWFSYVPHVDTPGVAQYSNAGGFSTARRVELAGVRYLRVSVQNTSAGAGTLNAWIVVSGDA